MSTFSHFYNQTTTPFQCSVQHIGKNECSKKNLRTFLQALLKPQLFPIVTLILTDCRHQYTKMFLCLRKKEPLLSKKSIDEKYLRILHLLRLCLCNKITSHVICSLHKCKCFYKYHATYHLYTNH